MKLEEARDAYEGLSMTKRYVKAKNVSVDAHSNVRRAAREELQMLIEEVAGDEHPGHVIRACRKKIKELKD